MSPLEKLVVEYPLSYWEGYGLPRGLSEVRKLERKIPKDRDRPNFDMLLWLQQSCIYNLVGRGDYAQ